MSHPQLQSNANQITAVVYGLGQEVPPNPQVYWKVPKLQYALPIKFTAIHMCQDRSIHSSLFAYVTMAFNAFTLIRVKTHTGKSTP